MSTAKTSSKRAKKKTIRQPKTQVPPAAEATVKPKWSMEERVVDPDAPYYGLSKEEFEQIAFWRKIPVSPEMEKFLIWFEANHERMRAETIEHADGKPTKLIPYDAVPL